MRFIALAACHYGTQTFLCDKSEVEIMANNQEKRGHQGGNASTNPGNFANNREKASEAGRKGGQASGGNFANDRERASEAGRVGGQHSHGGGRKQEDNR